MNAMILLVDDEPDILGIVELLLEKAGYEVYTACSALEALRVIREYGSPMVAVIDVAMPELSGLDLVRVLRGRQDTETLPVVFLSARVLESDIAAAMPEVAAFTALEKPPRLLDQSEPWYQRG